MKAEQEREYRGPVAGQRRKIFLLLAGLVFLQVAFISCYLPFSEWLSGSAIYTDDFGYHYVHILDKRSYLQEYGELWGYNPFQRAGSIANLIFTQDINGWCLFTFLFPFLAVEVSFKLFVILSLLSIPLLCYFSARNFNLSQVVAALCATMGTLYLHLSICVDFLYWGSVSYLLACYVSLLLFSLFYRALHAGKPGYLIPFTLVFSLGLSVHIFLAVNSVLPLLFVYVYFALKRLRWRMHLSVGLSVLIALIVNSFWIIPLYQFISTRDSFLPPFYATYSWLQPLKTYVLQSLIFNSYANIPFEKSAFVDIYLLLFGVLGLWQWLRHDEKEKACIFGLSVVALFMLSYYGSFWRPTAGLTPLRFTIFMNVCLVPPAAVGLRAVYDLFIRDRERKVRMATAAVLAYLLMVFCGPAYYHIYWKKDFRLLTRFPGPVQELVTWISRETSPEARILIEGSGFESGHQYYGIHFEELAPHFVDREFIGATPYNPAVDRFTSFHNGNLFLKPIEEYSLEEVQAYCDLYNVRWTICWSSKSREFFRDHPAYFREAGTIDKFFIFEVARKPSFFLRGSGKVSAELNRIYLESVQPEKGEIIISYHWMKFLKAEPPAEIEPVFFLEDPVGFLKVKNPPRELVIYNNYK